MSQRASAWCSLDAWLVIPNISNRDDTQENAWCARKTFPLYVCDVRVSHRGANNSCSAVYRSIIAISSYECRSCYVIDVAVVVVIVFINDEFLVFDPIGIDDDTYAHTHIAKHKTYPLGYRIMMSCKRLNPSHKPIIMKIWNVRDRARTKIIEQTDVLS